MSTIVMRTSSKSKNQNPGQSLTPEYLNFIRRNHVKFQMEQRLGAKLIEGSMVQNNDVFDDKKQFYQLNSQKRLPPVVYHQNEQETDQHNKNTQKRNNDDSQLQVGDIARNYKTLEIAPYINNQQKYQNYGQSTIIGKNNPSNNHNSHKSAHIYTQKPDPYQEQPKKNQKIKQTLLQNEEFIKLLQQKNKQIAYKLRNPQEKVHKHIEQKLNSHKEQQIRAENDKTPQKHKYRSQTPSNNHYPTESQNQLNNKALSQFKMHKPHSNNKDSNLLLNNKTHNMRDLWKEKFINWNNNQDQMGYKRYNKKKPHSELKFPHINGTSNQREDIKSNLNKKNISNGHDGDETNQRSLEYQELLELNECTLIKNSKPRPSKNQDQQRQVINQNHHLQLLGSDNGTFMIEKNKKQKNKQMEQTRNKKFDMIAEWQLGLVSRNDSLQNNQFKGKGKDYKQQQQDNPDYLASSLVPNSKHNGSISVIKRRRQVAQKMTNFLVAADPSNQNNLQSSTELRKSKNYKQLARQKQKQFQSYLMEHSILKSAKIVHYYEKQQIKKKNLFDEMQKNYCGLLSKHAQRQKAQSQEKKSKYTEKGKKNQQLAENKVNEIDKMHQKQQPQEYSQKFNDLKQSTNQTQDIPLQNPQQSLQSNLIDRPSQTKKKGPNINSIKKQYDLSIYEIKIRSYREFIFMVNLAHKVFININLKPASEAKSEPKFTYFIGKGNNRLLIKSLMNRRFWWEETRDQFKANFVWTQLKVNQLYQYESTSSYPQHCFDKLQDNNTDPQVSSPKKKKPQQKGPQKAACYKPPLPQVVQTKILTKCDLNIYKNIVENISQNPQNSLNFSNRAKFLPSQTFNTTFTQQTLHKQKVHNHLQFNYFIGNKKALFYNMHNYYKLMGKNAFDVIPYTLHIKKGVQDPAYNTFLKEYKKIAKEQATTGLKNIWIVKPGELSNRGQGITVIDEVYELNNILKKKQKHNNGTQKSYIVQKYIQKPLLYKNRKFDIRHYVLLTRFQGRFRAYFYGQGYIRTSSHEFKLDELDQMIHLTNDAIQKYGNSYGKHQDGNKVSYTEFQRYLDMVYGEGKHNFAEQIYPKMKGIALDAIKATYAQLDPKRLQHNFQLLGLDFMIDSKFNVSLIEVNTNPCLELSSKLLQRIIPQMAQNTLRVCIDPIFPPPTHFPNSLKHMCPDSPLQRLQYELIFDEARDGKQVQELFAKCNLKQLYKEMGEVDEEDATFENDGKQIQFKNEKANEDNQ